MISPAADKYHRTLLGVWLVADNTIAKYFMRIWQLLNYKLTQFVEVTPACSGMFAMYLSTSLIWILYAHEFGLHSVAISV